MKINKEYLPYLHGEVFDNGKSFDFSGNFEDQTRVDYIAHLVMGKKVIHMGCLDHLPLIEQKIENNQWLHGRISDGAAKTLGFDIDEEGVNFVNHQLGIDNIYLSDIVESVESRVTAEDWDYIILGEVLEHIDNPVDFLSKIRENYKGSVRKIVITVPNAISRPLFQQAKKGIEKINTDHRFWFTPFTIMKNATSAGLAPVELHFKNRVPLNFNELVFRKIRNSVSGSKVKYPFYYFNTLVLICDI